MLDWQLDLGLFTMSWGQMCVPPPVSEVLILNTMAPLYMLTRTCLISCHAVCAKCSRITWRLEFNGAEIDSSLYYQQRFPLDEVEVQPQNEIRNSRGPNWTSTTNSRPLCNRDEYPQSGQCQLGNGGVKKQICAACQPTASFSSVGCWKGSKNPHCLQGMTHTIHSCSLLTVCKQCKHSVWRGGFFLFSTNIKMATT